MSYLGDWFRQRRSDSVSTDRALASTFRRALLAVLEADYDKAEALITEAVKADSEDLEPYRSLARLYRLRGEIGRAIRIHQNLLLRRGLSDADRNGVLADLAGDFRQGGFLSRAVASYEEVLAHDPKHREALRALTDLCVEAGDYPAALATFRRLAKVERHRDPDGESRLLAGMAKAEHAAGQHEAARKAVKRALKRDPKNSEAKMLLGELEAERGRNKAALAAWSAVAAEGGEWAASAHPRLQSAFASQDKSREYEAFVTKLLDGRPDDASARTALAGALHARGETDAAVLELRRVLDGDPESLPGRIELGRLLLSEGRDADALKEFRELIEWLDVRAERIALGSAPSAQPPEEGTE